MSIMQGRGGYPHIFRATISTTGQKHQLPFNVSAMMVRNEGGNPCRMFFTEEDFTADSNYVLIPIAAAETPYGEWAAPAELGALARVWFKGVGGNADIALYAFQRRG